MFIGICAFVDATKNYRMGYIPVAPHHKRLRSDQLVATRSPSLN